MSQNSSPNRNKNKTKMGFTTFQYSKLLKPALYVGVFFVCGFMFFAHANSAQAAIVYVGSQGAGFAGTTSEQTINFSLTGGTDSLPAGGDLVIISYVIGSTANRSLAIRNASAVDYTLIGSELYQDDNFDSNQRTAYRFMPGTPETQFVLTETVSGGTGNITDAGRYTVHVFRNVDGSTPLDVAAASGGATNTRLANPTTITPTTSGAWIYVAGGAASATGGTFTASYLTAFLAGSTADTNDAQIGAGYVTWASGAYDPAIFAAGGTDTLNDSWTSMTVALRPDTTAGACSSTGSTGWATGATWTGTCSGPSGMPTAMDDVTILTGHNVTIATGVYGLADDVTVDGGGTLTITSTGFLRNEGNFTNSSGGTVTGTGAFTLNGTTKTIDGSGSMTGLTGLTTLTNDKTINGTAALSLGGALTVSTASTITINTSANITVAGTTTITGTVTNAGTFTASGTFTGGGSWTQNDGSTLNLAGATTNANSVTTFSASTNANTVNYNLNGDQTCKVVTYYHLTLSGGGAKTCAVTTVSGNMAVNNGAGSTTWAGSSNPTISGTLNIGAGATHNVGGVSLTVTGTTTIDGTMNINASAGTKTFGNIAVNSGGKLWFTTAAETVAMADLTNTSGTIEFDVLEVLNISGSITNNGTWDIVTATTTGAITMSGATKTISGSNAMTIASLASTSVTNTNTGGVTVLGAITGTLFTNGANGILTVGATPTVTTFTVHANANSVTYTGGTMKVGSNHYYDLTIAGTVTGVADTVDHTLTISSGSLTTAAGAFTVTGATNVNGGTLNLNGNTTKKILTGLVTVAGGTVNGTTNKTVEFGGGITRTSGTFDLASGLLATAVFTADQTLDGTMSFIGITLNSGVDITTAANSSITATGAVNGVSSCTCTWTQGDNSTLSYSNTATIFTTAGTLTATATGNTVNYSASGNQTVKATTYKNLTLSGSGTKTLSTSTTYGGNLALSGTAIATTVENMTVSGTLNVGSTASLATGNYTFSVTGAMTVDGTLTITNDLVLANTLGGAGTVVVNGGDVTGNYAITMTAGRFTVDGTGDFGDTANWSFNNLQFGDGTGAATTSLIGSGEITVNGIQTVKANQILSAGSKTVNLLGADAAGAFTFVQKAAGDNTGASQAGPLATTVSATGSGNLIVVWVKYEGNPVTVSVTDGTTAFTGRTQIVHTSGTPEGQFFYLLSSNAGKTSISTSWTGGTIDVIRVRVMEYSYTGTAAYDTENSTNNDSTTPYASGNITTTSPAGEVVFGSYAESNVSDVTATATINGGAYDQFVDHAVDHAAAMWSKTFTSTFTGVGAAASTVSSPTVLAAIAFKTTNVSAFTVEAGATFTAVSSTINYKSTTSTSIPNFTFKHLGLIPASGTPTYTLGTANSQTITVGGNLTIGSGTSLTVAGNTYNPTITVTGNFSIAASAAFTSTSGNLTIGGNFTNTPATTAGFAHNSGTVILNTTATAIVAGTTTFKNLQIATGDKTVNFTAGTTYTIAAAGVLTITGTLGHLVTIGSTAASAWTIDHQGTESVDYITISYSSCAGGSTNITTTNSTDGGNNGACWQNLATAGITISGIIYQNDGSTALDCSTGGNRTVRIKVNGLLDKTGDCSLNTGVFSVTSVTVALNDVLTVFLDGETEDAVTVTKAKDSSTNIIDLYLYHNRVTIRTETLASAMTILNMDQYDAGQDGDIAFTATDASPDTLVVADGSMLLLFDNATTTTSFTPGGNVTTDVSNSGTDSVVDGDLTIQSGATLTMGTNALSVGGDFANSGTFAKSTGQTTTLTATSTGFAITSGTGNFDSLTFNGSGGEWTPTNATVIDVDLTMTAGSLLGTQNVTVSGGDATGDGIINLTGGTLLIDIAGNFGGATGWIFNNLTFGDGSGSTSTTSTGAGGVTVSGVLTIAASQTLDAKGRTWTLSGTTGAPLVVTGVFDDTTNTSTLSFTGNNSGGDTTIPASTAFNNLTLNNGSETFKLGGTETISGDLVVTAGSLVDTDDVTVNGGDVTGAGTITMSGGTFTVAGTGSFGSSSAWTFNILTLNGTTTATGVGGVTVSDTLNLTSSLNANGQTFILTKAGTGSSRPFKNTGAFTGTSSTITYQGNGDTDIENVGYYNLTFTPLQTVTGKTYTLATGALAISHDWNINPDAGSALTLSVLLSGTTTVTGTITIQKTNSALSSLSTNGSNYDLSAGAINIVSGGALTANNSTITLTGSGTPFTVGGSFTPNGSTVVYNSTSATNITATTYNNLSLTPAGTPTYTLGTAGSQTIVVKDLLIGNGSNGVAVNHATWDPAINITGDFTIAASAGTFTKSDAAAVITLKPAGSKIWTDNTVQDIGVVVIGSGSATPKITLASSVKVTSLNLNVSHELDFNGTRTMTVTGSGAASSRPFIIAGTFTTSTGTVAYTGTSATEIESTTYNNLSLIPVGTPTYTLGTATSQTIATKDFTIGNGAQAVAVNHATYDPAINISGDFTIAASAGTFTKSDSPATITLKPAGTKTWTDNTGQDIGVVVIGSGSSTPKINLGSSVKVTSLNLNSSHELDFNGAKTLTLTGNGATVLVVGGTFTASTGTTSFVSGATTGTTVPTATYFNLTLNKASNTFTSASGTLGIGGNLAVTAGTFDLDANDPTATVTGTTTIDGTLIASSANPLTIKGTWTNNGTFTHSSGTVVVDFSLITASGTLTITGSTSPQTFNNFTAITATGGKYLKFKSGSTFVFAGLVTLTGTGSSPLYLAAITATSQWVATLNGTSALNFLAVLDSGCSGGNNWTTNDSILDLGNNGVCWGFIVRGGTGGGGNGGGSGGGTPVGGGGSGGSGSGDEGSGGGGGTLPQAFTAANATALTTYDSNWNNLGGAFAINTNSVYSNTAATDTMARWTAGTFNDNQYAEITIVASSTGYIGVGVRLQSGEQSGYGVYCNGTDSKIIEWAAGSQTTVHYTGSACTNSDVIRLEISGTGITLKKNGTTVTTVTDSTYTTGRPGLVGNGNSTSTRGDGFNADSLASQGGGGGGSESP